jgi:hypothetical protein
MNFASSVPSGILRLLTSVAFAQSDAQNLSEKPKLPDNPPSTFNKNVYGYLKVVLLFGSDAPELGVLTIDNMHNMEHCGNLVTYMRPKNIVPTGSEPGPPATAGDEMQPGDGIFVCLCRCQPSRLSAVPTTARPGRQNRDRTPVQRRTACE